MPGEVLLLHVGGAGCKIGLDLWDRLFRDDKSSAVQHSYSGLVSVEEADSKATSPFFFESRESSTPRCIFIDPYISRVHGRIWKEFIESNPECWVNLDIDCRNNFYDGVCKWRTDVSHRVSENLRIHIERCDRFSGFLVFHSLSGGTGSGIGVEAMEYLREEFPKQVLFEPIIFPSKDSSTSLVGPYNTIFGLSQAHRQASLSLMIDNQASFRICKEKRKITKPSYSHMNELIADMMSMATSSLRGRTTLNASLNEIVTNLVPEPDFHYPIVSYAPVNDMNNPKRPSPSVTELVSSLFRPESTFCDVPTLAKGRYFAASILCRGKGRISVPEIQKSLSNMRGGAHFVPWIPNSFKVGVVEQSSQTSHHAEAVLLANSTSVRDLFDREYKKFLHLLFHKSFVWQYLEAGAEMDDFLEAKESIKQLISLYDNTVEQSRVANVANMRTELNRSNFSDN
jgi:tubulin alpha